MKLVTEALFLFRPEASNTSQNLSNTSQNQDPLSLYFEPPKNIDNTDKITALLTGKYDEEAYITLIAGIKTVKDMMK